MPEYERYVEYTDTVEISPTELARLVVDMDEAEHKQFMDHLEVIHNDKIVCYFCGHEGDKPTPEESARISRYGAIAEARADLAARDSMCDEYYNKIGEMADIIEHLKKELTAAKTELIKTLENYIAVVQESGGYGHDASTKEEALLKKYAG